VVYNGLDYGLTYYFILGGGFEMFSLLLGKPIFMITPKVGFPISKKVHIGAGILYLNMLNMNSNGISLAFGNITFGDANSNISINIGSNIGNQGSPIFTLNGFQRLSPKFGIMTENWVLTNNENGFDIYSFGGRIIGRKNLFDFGLLTNKEITQFMLGIPFLSYTLKF